MPEQDFWTHKRFKRRPPWEAKWYQSFTISSARADIFPKLYHDHEREGISDALLVE